MKISANTTPLLQSKKPVVAKENLAQAKDSSGPKGAQDQVQLGKGEGAHGLIAKGDLQKSKEGEHAGSKPTVMSTLKAIAKDVLVHESVHMAMPHHHYHSVGEQIAGVLTGAAVVSVAGGAVEGVIHGVSHRNDSSSLTQQIKAAGEVGAKASLAHLPGAIAIGVASEVGGAFLGKEFATPVRIGATALVSAGHHIAHAGH